MMIFSRCVISQKWALAVCLLSVLMGVAAVQAQEVTVLSERTLSREGLAEVKERLLESTKENFPLLPGGLVYDNLQGPFSIVAGCPSGYVEKANYQFSSRVKVLIDEGTDCKGEKGGSCRAWHVSAEPEEEESYEFTMKLSCSSDDTLVLTQRTMSQEEIKEVEEAIEAGRVFAAREAQKLRVLEGADDDEEKEEERFEEEIEEEFEK